MNTISGKDAVEIAGSSLLPFFLNFDYLKDIILYLMLKETVNQIEKNCDQMFLEYDFFGKRNFL